MRDSVTVHMDAPADRIWELVSDVTQIGRFSPETFEAEWLDGASRPRPPQREVHLRRPKVRAVKARQMSRLM
jgi:hypothetical protein